MLKIKIKPSKFENNKTKTFQLIFYYSSEIVLKVLAHNNFIGRIIGKGGNIINTIKKETDTKFVSKKKHLRKISFFYSIASLYRVLMN
jgi:predicted RNA-binding protein YlqC (UPF0109 family)